VMQSAWLSAAS